MGGIYGVASKSNCVNDLYYGTDYHSHLGTCRGGMAVLDHDRYTRVIHNIENAQFRSKFEDDVPKMAGSTGIGCISDTEDQPLIIGSHLGTYAVVTVGRINNLGKLVDAAYGKRTTHFSEMGRGEINPTELIATLINREATFEDGIRIAQQAIDGSCTLLLLTDRGIYAARDFYGRTPLLLGQKEGVWCATMESCVFANLGYRFAYELGPGEIVLMTPEGMEQKTKPADKLRICTFLWIYYGYPASSYEGINVEAARYRCGEMLAKRDNIRVDVVAGVPDSGTAHAIGYANQAKVPYARPFVKYTPTWPRSFMPQNQEVRDLVASMKLIPIRELIHGKRLLFCEDSIVRGTQLRQTIQRLYDDGAREVHMRPACPPLVYGCKFLNFSRSRSIMDLAARKAIHEMGGDKSENLDVFTDPAGEPFQTMVDRIREQLNLTTLRYQTIPDMLKAIGLPKKKVCTYCWNEEG